MRSRSALVIARAGRSQRLPNLPWLATRFGVHATDWIVFCDDGWRDILAGDAGLWTAFEHKLLAPVYLHRPALVAVVGQPAGDGDASAIRDEVRRIAERLRWYSLPAAVIGVVANDAWGLEEVVEPEPAPLSEEAESIA